MLTIARQKFFNRYLPLALSIILLATAGFFWYQVKTARASYTYSSTITIAHGKVGGGTEDEPNFTVLVCANMTLGNGNPCQTVSGLNETGAGAEVTNANGYDIVFSTVAGCASSLMNWEMPSYASSTGATEAWVLITSLSHTSDTTFYMCWGNSLISTFQGGSTGSAWDSGYKGVYHLANGTTLSAVDSTSYGNSGTITGSTATSGQIDGGANFVASSNQYITMPNAVTSGKAMTISGWIKTSSLSQNPVVLDARGNASEVGCVLYYDTASSNHAAWYCNNTVTEEGSTNLNDGNWHYLVGTIASLGTPQALYVDGLQITSQSVSGLAAYASGSMYMGKSSDASPVWTNGNVDEVTVSNVARSAGWINTEYNNQSSPTTFEVMSPNSCTPASGYSYCRPITINNNYVSSSGAETYANFPVLVCANATVGGGNSCPTLAGLNQTGGGAHVKNSNGYDIIFTSDSAGATQIPAERENYVASTGELEEWVDVNGVSTTSATSIYMSYGNASISTDPNLDATYGAAKVWDTNYRAVWHFNDASTSASNDSTANGYNLSNVGTTLVAGAVGKALSMSGASSSSTIASTLGSPSKMTMEGWIWLPTYSYPLPNGFMMIGLGGACFNSVGITMNYNAGASYRADYGQWCGPGGVDIASWAGNLGNAWYHVAFTINPSASYDAVYINGGLSATSTSSVAMTYGAALTQLGRDYYGANPLTGYLDEIRISSIDRSADWIKTEYNNQSAPATFEIFGSEDIPPSGFNSAALHPGITIQSAKVIIKNGKVRIQPQ
jgi:hypothetical protein